MKHRLKFRVLQSSGTGGKIAINLEDGEPFTVTSTLFGEASGGGETKSFCQVHVKNLTTYVTETNPEAEMSVNEKRGSEFTLKPGDLLKVGNGTLEFLDVPHQEVDPDNATRYIDVAELKRAAKKAELAVNADALAPAQIAPVPAAEPSAAEPIEKPRSQSTRGKSKPASKARAAYKSISNSDGESGFSRPFRPDWRRKMMLGILTGSVAALGGVVFHFGTRNHDELPVVVSGETEALKRLQEAPPEETIAPPANVTDRQMEEVHMGLQAALIRPRTRSIAMENDSLAASVRRDRIRFFFAVRYGDLKTVRQLVSSKKIDPNGIMESSATPLMQAAYYGQINVLKYFIALKLKLNAQDTLGATPLMYAARGNQPSAASLLLKAGADPKIRKNDGQSALDVAQRLHYRKVVAVIAGFRPPKRRVASTRR